jgi:hypothetical protein
MNKELTEKLATKYPKLFRDLGGDPRQTCMTWGICCGDGWFNILETLCEGIQLANPPEDFCFNQIKEKFGGLRVYASPYIESIEAMISAAETASYKTCENCGSTTDVTVGGERWIRTLCKDCRGTNDQA